MLRLSSRVLLGRPTLNGSIVNPKASDLSSVPAVMTVTVHRSMLTGRNCGHANNRTMILMGIASGTTTQTMIRHSICMNPSPWSYHPLTVSRMNTLSYGCVSQHSHTFVNCMGTLMYPSPQDQP